MDTIVFALILISALLIIFVNKRWVVVLGYALAFAGTAFLFAHHMTSGLDLSF
jgi:hypothetical protein